MGEHVYAEFLYPAASRSDLLPPIVDRLDRSLDGSFVGPVDPETTEHFGYGFDGEPVDAAVWVSFEDEGVYEAFDRPRIELRAAVSALHDDEYETDAWRCRAFVDVVRAVYLATDARPGLVYSCSMVQGQTEPPVGAEGLAGPRAYLTWLDVFPPAEVEAIGRDRLLDAPAPVVEELDDGGVLVCSEHPLLPEGVYQLSEVAEHVGIPHWLEYVYS